MDNAIQSYKLSISINAQQQCILLDLNAFRSTERQFPCVIQRITQDLLLFKSSQT